VAISQQAAFLLLKQNKSPSVEIQCSDGAGGGGRPVITDSLSLRGILTGFLLSLLAAVCGSFLATLVVIIGDWEANLEITFRIFSCLSIAFGGLAAGKRANAYGWLHGGIVGVLYVGLFIILFGQGAETHFISLLSLQLLTGFVFGAIGGVIGVNL